MMPQFALVPSGGAPHSKNQEAPQRVRRDASWHADPLHLLAALRCTALAAVNVVLDARPFSFQEAG